MTHYEYGKFTYTPDDTGTEIDFLNRLGEHGWMLIKQDPIREPLEEDGTLKAIKTVNLMIRRVYVDR